MGANGYRPPDNDRVTANTDILSDIPQRHGREDLIPIIARKSQNASNVNPVYFEYFQRIKTGRRCSCFTVETDPQGICRVCFGTGIVGGYNKRGTKTEVFDVTYKDVACVNVSPDYTHPTRPVYWSMVKTAVRGSINFEIPITSNVGILDLLDIKDYQPEGTEILYYVKAPAEASFVLLSEKEVERRLGNKKLQFQVIMRRKTPNAPLPKIVAIRFAYKLVVHTAIRVDIPRTQENLSLDDLGVIQSFSQKNYWLDSTVKNCSSEDFMVNLDDKTRWKIVQVSDNKPMGMLTSWDLTARIIQEMEGYSLVPIGKYDSRFLPKEIKSIQTDQEDTDAFLDKSDANHLRRPGNRTQTTPADGPAVIDPGQTDIGEQKREV